MKFIVSEKDYEYEYVLSSGKTVVGRGGDCDLKISSKAVSRRHLSCHIDEGEVFIKDLGSRNGVKVNGKKVEEATIREGDIITLGDVSLVLEGVAGAGGISGGALVNREPDQAPEPELEDEEITPAEGSLIKKEPPQGEATMYEKDGRWYVADPATGREVEIAPVGEKGEREDAGRAKKSILASKKGRIILGIAAAAIILLLLIGLTVQDPEPEAPPREVELDEGIAATLNAIEEGELDRAGEMAQFLKNRRPESGAAESLDELVSLWKQLDQNFLEYWVDVRRKLENLQYHHASGEVRRFVRRHLERIDEAGQEFEHVDRAREASSDGDYETAYQILTNIDEDQPARKENTELVEEVEESLRRQLKARLERAESDEQWGEAREASDKLMSFFPEMEDELREKNEKFATLAEHSEILSRAREAVEEGVFEDVPDILEQLPETSRYYDEGRQLLESSEQLNTVRTAEEYFTEGYAEEALDMIENLEVDQAHALKERIQEAHQTYLAALAAEDERNFETAQQQWERLVELEEGQQPSSLFLSEAQTALRDMPRKRLNYVLELTEQADDEFHGGEYKRSVQTLRTAMEEVPEGTEPPDELTNLRETINERGIREYQFAINETDPERALERFEIAMVLLPTDHEIYRRASERKRELERELKE